MSSNSDKYQKIADSILSRLGDGNIENWKKCWKSMGVACSLEGREYSGRNALLSLLMSYENYETPYFGTYKGLQKKDLQVRKGEKSFPVMYFTLLEKENKETQEIDSIPLLRLYQVFNIDQCDGDKTQFEKKLAPINADSRIEKIDEWIKSQNITIEVGDPSYSPLLHLIRMPHFEQFKSANDYYATFFHELTHSTKKALGREQSKKFGDPIYAFEELIAESGSAILMSHFGLAPTLRDDHTQYIKSWIKGLNNEPKQFIDAFSHATKAVNHLLGIDKKEELKEVA